MRDIIALACTECKRRNYSTTKNKKKTTERLELSKYCRVLPQAHAASGNEVACRASPRASAAEQRTKRAGEAVAQLAEQRSPKPGVGGSIPSGLPIEGQ